MDEVLPRITVSAVLDGSDVNMDEVVLWDLRRFAAVKAKAGAAIEISATAHRIGVTGKGRLAQGALRLLGSAAIIAGACGLGYLTGYPQVGLLLGCVADYRLLPGGALHLISAGARQVMGREGPDWKGRRAFQFQEQGEPSVTLVSADALQPRAEELRDQVVASCERFPQATAIAWVHGHGLGGFTIAEMKPAQIGAALAHAHRKSGRKVGVLVLHSCLEACLESLCHFEAGAEVAVVSEAPLRFDALTADHVLLAALDGAADARAIGQRIVQVAAAEKLRDSAIVALDLSRLNTRLLPALDSLGRHLLMDMMHGHTTAIQNALQRAGLAYAALRLVDLEKFVLALKEALLPDKSAKTVDEVGRALDDITLGKYLHQKGMLGVAFHADPSLHVSGESSSPLIESPLPKYWKALILAVHNPKLLSELSRELA